VTFKSADSFAAAWFFLPEGGVPGARVPAVALAPGTGGVKELYHEPFARRLDQRRAPPPSKTPTGFSPRLAK
jgi:hypothetical protein